MPVVPLAGPWPLPPGLPCGWLEDLPRSGRDPWWHPDGSRHPPGSSATWTL